MALTRTREPHITTVDTIGVLELMWMLRKRPELLTHVVGIDTPTSEKLRNAGLFELQLGASPVGGQDIRDPPAGAEEGSVERPLERQSMADNSEVASNLSLDAFENPDRGELVETPLREHALGGGIEDDTTTAGGERESDVQPMK